MELCILWGCRGMAMPWRSSWHAGGNADSYVTGAPLTLCPRHPKTLYIAGAPLTLCPSHPKRLAKPVAHRCNADSYVTGAPLTLCPSHPRSAPGTRHRQIPQPPDFTFYLAQPFTAGITMATNNNVRPPSGGAALTSAPRRARPRGSRFGNARQSNARFGNGTSAKHKDLRKKLSRLPRKTRTYGEIPAPMSICLPYRRGSRA
jgi:hypothetical protein